MAVVQLKLGPASHGLRLSLEEYDAAEYEPGFRYEIIDGRLYVAPAPNASENFLERWLRKKIEQYADDHPDVLAYVSTRSRVFLPARRSTVPEPDIAAYAEYPFDLPIRKLNWAELNPCLVAEVLVDGDIGKDLTRNPALYLKLPSIQEYWVLNGAVDPDQPSLIQHRRKGKRWLITTFDYGSTFTTPMLPGFALAIDPRR